MLGLRRGIELILTGRMDGRLARDHPFISRLSLHLKVQFFSDMSVLRMVW